MPNYSTILDVSSVITLGHTSNVPLIRLPSELSYRSEPHGHIPQRGTAVSGTADARQWEGRVYPGWAWVGTGRVVYRVLTRDQA